MQTEIKIVDEDSKLFNWKRLDYLMGRMRVVGMTVLICVSALAVLAWLVRV